MKTRYGTTGAPSGVPARSIRNISRAMASTIGLDRGWISGESSSMENVCPWGWSFATLPTHSITIGRLQVPLGPL